jgi:RNA polymerase sigma-70 factor, ECF subfamily
MGLRDRAQRAARDAAQRRRRAPRAARAGVVAPALDAEEHARIEDLAELQELRSAIAAALAELSAEQREAVRLRVIDELDYPTVADRPGISEQAARARVSRGLRVLAPAVDELAGTEAPT